METNRTQVGWSKKKEKRQLYTNLLWLETAGLEGGSRILMSNFNNSETSKMRGKIEYTMLHLRRHLKNIMY